jgi:hypothetical protein
MMKLHRKNPWRLNIRHLRKLYLHYHFILCYLVVSILDITKSYVLFCKLKLSKFKNNPTYIKPS